MKHPSPEELIAFAYEEPPGDQKDEIALHLSTCVHCREQLGAYKETQKALDEWQLESQPSRRKSSWRDIAKYAAAAIVVLGAGFLGGRLSLTALNTQSFREEMKAAANEWLAKSGQVQLDQIRQMEANLDAKLKTAQLQSAAEYASLRKELETVAILTQASLQQAQQQIVQLAGNTNPKH